MDNRLFLDNIEPIDEFYLMVRDDTREEILKGKEFMEELWEQYYEYADKDFPQKLSEDFHARFWEMYLTCTLIKRGYPVCPKAARSEGPDILVQDSKNTIYIEAVTPSEGHEDNVDKVPKMQMMKATRVPDEQITLRYCGVISEKHKKYISYLEKGVITNSDAYIIAVNSCKIEQAIIETDVPRIMKAILPIGYEQVTISRIPGSEASWHHQYRKKISRSKGSSVNTDIFLNQYYEGLSGVIYTRTDLFNRPPLMGDNYIFVHNPLAQNHIPNGFFNFGTEYYIELKPKSFSFHSKKWE
jgi:type I restriction enzyme S subunit